MLVVALACLAAGAVRGGGSDGRPAAEAVVASDIPEAKIVPADVLEPLDALGPASKAQLVRAEKPKRPPAIVVANLTAGPDARPTTWGNAIYPEQLPSWSVFARTAGLMSRECDVSQPTVACGTELVCRNGVCAPCMSDSECLEKHRCEIAVDGRNVCVPRVLSKHFSYMDGWLTVMVFVCTVLSAASGVGGGGMFVPLFLLFLDFTPMDAVPLSQCLIVLSSMVNLAFFILQRHPENRMMPKIDWDTVMLLEPGLACGVVVGVMLNRVSPRWLVTVLLLVTLGLSFVRSSQKGWSLWQKENEAFAKADAEAGTRGRIQSDANDPKARHAFCDIDIDTGALELLKQHRVPILVVTVIWLCTFLSNFHNVKTCSWQFVIYLGVFFVAMGGITYGAGRYLQVKLGSAKKGGAPDGPDGPPAKGSASSLEFTPKTTVLYPAVAAAAGLLGGMLGLGGGIIMAPFLIELGLHPEAIQASTALFVFISSSLASLQFAINNQIMPEYVAWYGTVAVVATLLGQTVVNGYIRRSGRSSIIVMCIACVLLVSAVMMTFLGITGTIADMDRGAYMGLDFYRLCLQ